MTGDPKRLIDGTDPAGALERELLTGASPVDPPEQAQAQVWSRIAAQVAIASAAGSALAPSAAAAKAGLGSIAPKAAAAKLAWTLAAAGGVVVGAGGYVAYRQSQPAFTAPAPVASQPRPQTAPAPAPEPSDAPVTETDPCAGAGDPPCTDDAERTPSPPRKRALAPARPDLLAAESALLAEARARLRAGDARAAQAVLDRLGTRFPRGVLGQEREVLAIEVLAARGDRAAARRRAQAFIGAYPESPHSQQLGRFLVAP